jgi:hypothetical protein
MAAHEERRTTDGIKRRSVLRGGLLVGVGLATAGIASAALTGTAKAVSPQSNWAYCKNCKGMWYPDGSSPGGVCPAYPESGVFGHVDSTSYRYELFNSSSGGGSSPGYQPNWHWCSQCSGLWTTNQGGGFCPGAPSWIDHHDAGPHTAAGSFEYYLYFDQVSGNNPQPNWRWCGYCAGLYFQGSSGNQAGVCPNPNAPGGYHNEGSGSYNYSVDWDGSF